VSGGAHRAWCAALVLASAALAPPAWGTDYIARDAWPDIRRGIQVTQYPSLARLVGEFERGADAGLVILYPGGEAGQSWATEIRDWLVALGIPSRAIALRPGSGMPDAIGLRVEQQGFK